MDPFGLYTNKKPGAQPQTNQQSTELPFKVTQFEKRDKMEEMPVYQLLKPVVDDIGKRITTVPTEQKAFFELCRLNDIPDNLAITMIYAYGVSQNLKFSLIFPYLDGEKLILACYGYLHTSLVLEKYSMSLMLPDRIVYIEDAVELDDESVISYEPSELPHLEIPDSYLMSNVMIDKFAAEEMKDIEQDMLLIAAQKNISPNCVTSTMLGIDFPDDIFSDEEPVAVNKESANVIKDITKSHVDRILPSEELHVLYADGGNMLPLLARTTNRNIHLHFTSDYPGDYYEKKLEIVTNLFGAGTHRFTPHTHEQTMAELLATRWFNGKHVLANYVPEALSYKDTFKTFSSLFLESDGANDSLILPSTPSVVRDYIKSEYAEDLIKKKKVSILDRSSDIRATFDQHQVWLDKTSISSTSIELADIMTSVFRVPYSGSLKYDCTYRTSPIRELEGTPHLSPIIPNLFISDRKVFSYEASEVYSQEWKGDLILDGISYPIFVDGHVYSVQIRGDRYLVDATLPGNYIARWWRLIGAGVPIAPFSDLGVLSIPLAAHAPGAFFWRETEDCGDHDFDAIDSILDSEGIQPYAVASGVRSYGIVSVEGTLSYSPEEEFFFLPEGVGRSYLRSARLENFRIRYGQVDYNRRGRLLFRDVHSTGAPIIDPREIIDFTQFPQEMQEEFQFWFQ